MTEDYQLPRRHTRSVIVDGAERELHAFLGELSEKHELTLAEHFQVVSRVFGSYLNGLARSWIRQERHPENPDRPGDLE